MFSSAMPRARVGCAVDPYRKDWARGFREAYSEWLQIVGWILYAMKASKRTKSTAGDKIAQPLPKSGKAKDALKGNKGLPLHPGAARYYKEKGLM